LHLAAEEAISANRHIHDDSAVGASSLVNGSVDLSAERCCANKHSCSSTSVVSHNFAHADSDCTSAISEICGALTNPSICQVFHSILNA